MVTNRKFLFDGEIMTIDEPGTYADGSPAVTVTDENGLPYGKLTVYIPGTKLEHGEYLIKGWSENAPMVDYLRNHGMLIPTGRVVRAGYSWASVCTFREGLNDA